MLIYADSIPRLLPLNDFISLSGQVARPFFGTLLCMLAVYVQTLSRNVGMTLSSATMAKCNWLRSRISKESITIGFAIVDGI